MPGLFTTVDDTDVLVGTLFGGPACTVAEPIDYYGRFDRFFDNHAGVHLQHTDPPSEDDHGDTVAQASPAVVGSEVAGEIDGGADADVFRIARPAPRYVDGLHDGIGGHGWSFEARGRQHGRLQRRRRLPE